MREESLRYFCGFARFANEIHLSCVCSKQIEAICENSQRDKRNPNNKGELNGT